MKKDNLSRRDFLKITLLGMGAGFLAACKRAVKPLANGIATFTATPTKTNTPTPTQTSTPTSTPSQTPTPTEIPCFRLLSPENGAKLPATGKVTFSWEAMQGAAGYQLQFTFPSGQVVSFDIESTNNTRYIETFVTGGIYTWQVVALDGNGYVTCAAESFTFEKPASILPQNNNGGGGNNDDGSDLGDGGGETVTVDSTSTDGEETVTVDNTTGNTE